MSEQFFVSGYPNVEVKRIGIVCPLSLWERARVRATCRVVSLPHEGEEILGNGNFQCSRSTG